MTLEELCYKTYDEGTDTYLIMTESGKLYLQVTYWDGRDVKQARVQIETIGDIYQE